MKVTVKYIESETLYTRKLKAHHIGVQTWRGGRGIVVLSNKKGKKKKTILFRQLEVAEKTL